MKSCGRVNSTVMRLDLGGTSVARTRFLQCTGAPGSSQIYSVLFEILGAEVIAKPADRAYGLGEFDDPYSRRASAYVCRTDSHTPLTAEIANALPFVS
jgi:hypothetical protein